MWEGEIVHDSIAGLQMVVNICFYKVFCSVNHSLNFKMENWHTHLFQKLLDRFDYDDEPEAVEESKKEDAAAAAAAAATAATAAATTAPAAAVAPPAPAAAVPSVAATAASPPQAPLWVAFFWFLSR